MEIVGYIAAIVIGISLGLIGGGGSILTVPVLVYLFQVDVVLATAYSLCIVGLTSAVGSIRYFINKQVHLPTAIVFGIPSVIAVFLTRAYIVPLMPHEILHIGSFHLTKDVFILILFAILMIGASLSMIRPPKRFKTSQGKYEMKYVLILLEGLIVGGMTGMVGAGGGFLIIPALVILARLPMKEAIGTSLIIITMKSLIGFLGEKDYVSMDWKLLSTVTLAAVAGIFVGSRISKSIDGEKLKPAFGWFVLAMGMLIIISELFIN